DFLSRMLGILNDGMLCLGISIGHQTGLFDTMADGAKATSAEIAKRAGLNERYVREWLGAMVTGRIVDYDAATKTYTLPPERSLFLDGEGLGTVWGKELALAMLADAGFDHVDVKQVEGDILNNYYVAYPN